MQRHCCLLAVSVHLSAVLSVKSWPDMLGIVECISVARFSKKKNHCARTDFLCIWGKMNSVHCGCSHLNNDMQNLDSRQVPVTVNS